MTTAPAICRWDNRKTADDAAWRTPVVKREAEAEQYDAYLGLLSLTANPLPI
ncbi:MAG TPA: hypothetical protein GXX47_04100 [Firmicutes bacterium]|nr:hypothetical protein [Bacillota bacterium]